MMNAKSGVSSLRPLRLCASALGFLFIDHHSEIINPY